ncbi:MAG: DUF2437 domain-containing protein [Butyricicoccaceae bacterium]
MKFVRVMYEGRAEWAIVEEKYVRLIDRAPWEDWTYLGPEIRLARAKRTAPVQKGEPPLPDGIVCEDDAVIL